MIKSFSSSEGDLIDLTTNKVAHQGKNEKTKYETASKNLNKAKSPTKLYQPWNLVNVPENKTERPVLTNEQMVTLNSQLKFYTNMINAQKATNAQEYELINDLERHETITPTNEYEHKSTNFQLQSNANTVASTSNTNSQNARYAAVIEISQIDIKEKNINQTSSNAITTDANQSHEYVNGRNSGVINYSQQTGHCQHVVLNISYGNGDGLNLLGKINETQIQRQRDNIDDQIHSGVLGVQHHLGYSSAHPTQTKLSLDSVGVLNDLGESSAHPSQTKLPYGSDTQQYSSNMDHKQSKLHYNSIDDPNQLGNPSIHQQQATLTRNSVADLNLFSYSSVRHTQANLSFDSVSEQN